MQHRSVGSIVVGLLGPVATRRSEATDDADESALVPVSGTRSRRLLAALALEPGVHVSAHTLIDLVWDGQAPRSPVAALHTQISRLRGVLPAGAIESGANGYRLTLRDDQIDIGCARRLIDSGERSGLDAAAALWRGLPGADLGDDQLARSVAAESGAVRRRLDEARIRAALESKDPDSARDIAESLVAADELDEVAATLLMQTLAAQGRAPEALAVYTRLRLALSRELGADPGADVTSLHRRLLADADADAEDGRGPRATVPRRSVAIGLRSEPNALIGRDDDLDRIEEMLSTSRVVTIQGTGGAGKTRVANAVGHRMSEQFPRVVSVPLASVRADADVIGSVASTLGISDTDLSAGGRPRLIVDDLTLRVAETLTTRRTLLILDNCEQVIDACATLVDTLVGAVEDLTVLATSRSPLMIAAERIYPLPPLDTDSPDAAGPRLFAARARAIRPGVALDRGQVSRLCAQLDGLPLAIELAAARVRTMSVDEISERLEHRFALLRSNDRSSPERHRTLTAVIEWSWELLDPAAQRVWTALCLLPGGFDLRLARAVSGMDDIELEDALGALVDQSLLTVVESDGHIRYRMLEMVREYGELRLDAAGGRDAVEHRMALWAIAFCDEIRAQNENSQQRTALSRMTVEVGNLVWAVRTSMAGAAVDGLGRDVIIHCFPVLAVYWSARGMHAEVRAWAVPVISALADRWAGGDDRLTDDQRVLTMVSVLFAAGHILVIPPVDLRLVARARIMLRQLHRPDQKFANEADFVTAVALGFGQSRYGTFRLIVRAHTSSNPLVRGHAAMMKSNAAENLGNIRGALRYAREALEISRISGQQWTEAMALSEIGGASGSVGRFDDAVVNYRRAATLMLEIGATEDALQMRLYEVLALLSAGHHDLASTQFQAFRDSDVDDKAAADQPEVVAAAELCVAEIARIDGDHDRAATLFERMAVKLYAEHPMPERDPTVVFFIADAICGLVLTGRISAAAVLARRAAATVRALFDSAMFFDYPQAGSTAIAVGVTSECVEPGSVDAARLMLLGLRVRPRRDMPSVNAVVSDLRAHSAVDDATWADLSARVQALSMRAALGELLDRLAVVDTVGL